MYETKRIKVEKHPIVVQEIPKKKADKKINSKRKAAAITNEESKQFLKYLQKSYGERLFRRYQGILNNEKKFDPKKLREKYSTG